MSGGTETVIRIIWWVYKSAYSNAEAYKMILNGECGQFSDDVIECFKLAKEDFFNIVEVINMFNFT